MRVLVIACAALGACSSGGSDFKTALTTYNTGADQALGNLITVTQNAQAIQTAVQANDLKTADQLWDTQSNTLDLLLKELDDLQATEVLIEGQLGTSGSSLTERRPYIVPLVIGAGMAIYSLYKFGKWLKGQSDQEGSDEDGLAGHSWGREDGPARREHGEGRLFLYCSDQPVQAGPHILRL